MGRRLVAPLLALTLAAAGGVGCGDDDGGGGDGTTTTDPGRTSVPTSTTEPEATTSTSGPDGSTAPGTGPDGPTTPGTGADGGTAAPVARATFVANADALCRTAEEDIRWAAESVPDDASDAVFDAFIANSYVPRMQRLLADLRELAPPDSGAAEAAAVFDGAGEVVDAIAAMPSRLRDDDWTATNAEPVGERAEAFGFEACFT